MTEHWCGDIAGEEDKHHDDCPNIARFIIRWVREDSIGPPIWVCAECFDAAFWLNEVYADCQLIRVPGHWEEVMGSAGWWL